MIARRLAVCVCNSCAMQMREAPDIALCSSITMFELLVFHLLWMAALLVAVATVCCIVNGLWPDASLDALCVFAAVACFALAFDAALTFLVFADAQQRYGQFSTTPAFAGRACAYGLAGTAGLGLARWRARRRARRVQALRMNAAP
jgi:hypothetical protein